ncbi:MAG: hypothetical protein OXC46_01190 [Thaumarchaeota archaeon]|nr:hypothetical protein [Nitrososphaerota archaeon]
MSHLQRVYKDCNLYVKRLRRESDSLFIFLMNDVESEQCECGLREFATYRQIPYGKKTENGARRTKIIMNIHATCEQCGVDFGQLLQDYLSGKAKSIPPRAKSLPVIA